jgi:hypothetical protein
MVGPLITTLSSGGLRLPQNGDGASASPVQPPLTSRRTESYEGGEVMRQRAWDWV